MALITNKHKLELAKAYSDLISTGDVYLYVGGISPWTTEASPPTPIDKDADDISIWNNMVFCKKVTNKSFVVPRYDYTAGTQYEEYSHDTDFAGLKFYIYSDDNSNHNIWKCISNNGGEANTAGKPTVTNIIQGGTANKRQYVSENLAADDDGYIWKHMTTISTTDYDNFATITSDSIGAWLPISISDIIEDNREKAVPGEVYHIAIKSPYTLDSSATWSGVLGKKVTLIGDGSDFEGIIYRIPSGNYYIQIVNKGSGYFNIDGIQVDGLSTHPTLSGSIAWSDILKPIVSPIRGHSYDAVEELHTTRLMVTVDLAESETGLMSENQFRQVGLIYRPYAYSSGFDDYTYANKEALGTKFINASGIPLYKFTLNGPADLFGQGSFSAGMTEFNNNVGGTTDFIVTQRNASADVAKGKVVEVVGDGTSGDIYVTFENGYNENSTYSTITTSDNSDYTLLITGPTATDTAEYNAVVVPTVKQYTGSILYKANIPPITRQSSSIQKLRLVLEF